MRAALALALLAAALGARAAPAELIVEAELLPARVYVGGEALLRLRALRAPGIPHGVLRPPELGEAAQISLAGAIDTYQSERAGVTYDVLERTHVIVPRRAGRLVVPGAEFESVLRYAEVFQRDARTTNTPLTARGPQQVLEVRAIPVSAGEPWLPARALTLEESWSRDLDALSTGTPVTRTLVLQAEGLAAERLPRLEMAPHPSLLVHHDQPELFTEYRASGMAGRRVQRIVLMPVGAGALELPEMNVRWWDVGADVPRVATVSGRTLRLHAAIAPAAAPPIAEEGVSWQGVLRWSLLGIVVAGVLAFWWHERTRAPRDARKKLRTACRRNDARGARDALIEWGKAMGAPPALDLAQAGAPDAALYGGGAWDGKAFWRAARPRLRKRKGRRAAPPRSGLPAFFRLQPPRG
ncbi:MAG: hypothetical protein OEW96_09305 [Betaproteobacteria bacterium]|nr:hypothetical protein [Betaproteobacteria bacterium]